MVASDRVLDALDLRRWLLDDDPAQWAEAFVHKLAAGRPVPDYGGSEWLTADWTLQVASAVRAGETWRRDGLLLPQRLDDEIRAGSQWLDLDAELFLVEACRNLRSVPSHAELVERRRAA